MKKALFYLYFLLFFAGFSQTYQLIPDSCTFCLFLNSTGGNSWYEDEYSINPFDDTTVLGNQYITATPSLGAMQPFAFRQVDNKLFGVVQNASQEYLIMDFDTDVGDTIWNLYSEGVFYNAVVTQKDSVLVNFGTYHHFRKAQAFSYWNQGVEIPDSWEVTWNERGLCGFNTGNIAGFESGGYYYNLPSYFLSISAIYGFPDFCTTDPLYTITTGVSCQNCVPEHSSIEENNELFFTISPNPVSHQAKIEFQTADLKTIRIIDALGKLLHTSRIDGTSIELDFSRFKKGLYYIMISSNNARNFRRIIKN